MATKISVDVRFRYHGQEMSKTFEVDPGYEVGDVVGSGAYGVVTKGTYQGEPVAIKRIEGIFKYIEDGKRSIRELKVLGMIDHPNVLKLKDILTIPADKEQTFEEIYIVTDLFDCDLDRAIKSGLNHDQIQYFMYQLFKGLKYLHSAGVLHRDLKPANCLIQLQTMSFQIADFGLARPVADAKLTASVVTQHYRAPEVIVDRDVYGPGVDVWSAATIVAECFTKQPFIMVRGVDQVKQLERIVYFVGKPEPEVVARIRNTNARRYVESLPADRYPRCNFRDHLPDDIPADALDLIEKILVWEDDKRLTAESALVHPYFEDVRDEETELVAPARFEPFDFENQVLDVPRLRRLIYNEMLRYHPEIGQHVPAVDGRTDHV